jgi:hypothetical protein
MELRPVAAARHAGHRQKKQQPHQFHGGILPARPDPSSHFQGLGEMSRNLPMLGKIRCSSFQSLEKSGPKNHELFGCILKINRYFHRSFSSTRRSGRSFFVALFAGMVLAFA